MFPDFFLCFLALFLLVGFGGEGGIRTSFVLRPCTKHWYLPCFRLFVQHTAQVWNKTRCHKRPCQLRRCRKNCIYLVFASLYSILHKDVEQAKLSQVSMPLASMPKTLVFTAFSPLCTTYSARMWNKKSCHKHPCQLRRCPKNWHLPRFRLFVQHTAQGCGTRKAVTSVHAFG